MTTAASAPPAALTFPRPIFASVSPHSFLQAHLSEGKTTKTPIRANNRAGHEFRTLEVNTGSLTHCNGSAVVRLGNTSVVCGIRAEILKEEDIADTHAHSVQGPGQYRGNEQDEDDRQELEGLRLLVPNIELSTGGGPAHLPGNAPSTFAQTLITRIRSLLHSTRLVRASDLRILHKPSSNPDDPTAEPDTQLKGYWVLYLDVFFISIDGNAFDASWLSILSALRNTLLPHAFFDEEFEGILCSDDRREARRLSLRGLPVPSTFAVFEGVQDEQDGRRGQPIWVLSDPDAFEEGVCREGITVVVDGAAHKKRFKDALVCRIEKSGGGAVDREMMQELLERAKDRWSTVETVLSRTA